jgi:hypothetical protein
MSLSSSSISLVSRSLGSPPEETAGAAELFGGVALTGGFGADTGGETTGVDATGLEVTAGAKAGSEAPCLEPFLRIVTTIEPLGRVNSTSNVSLPCSRSIE